MSDDKYKCTCGEGICVKDGYSDTSTTTEDCGECEHLKEIDDPRKADSSGSNEFDLLCCAGLAKAMNDNKKQIVILDENHNVSELDVAKYGINDNVILVYVKRVE